MATSEKREQMLFVEWFRKTYFLPFGVVILMVRNDGTRSLQERGEQRALGLHPGTPDLFVPEWRLWIEMKKAKGGKISPEQIAFKDYVLSLGDAWIMPRGFEEGKKMVLDLGFEPHSLRALQK